MITIGSKTAIIYQGGGRWCITKRTAYRRAARAAIASKHACECDGPSLDEVYPGNTCERHGSERDAFARLEKRFVRWLQWRDAQIAKGVAGG